MPVPLVPGLVASGPRAGSPGLVPVPLVPGLATCGASGAGPRHVSSSPPAPAAASVANAAQPKTTLMLRNLGAEVTTEILLEELRLFGMEGRVDFAHSWVDFQTKLRTGDAYLNFFDPADASALQEMWHGRKEFRLLRTRGPQRPLNVAFARKQGFDCCVLEARRKHFKDPSMMAWIHPSKEDKCRALEKNPKAPAVEVQPVVSWAASPPLSLPGFWHLPGLATSCERARVKKSDSSQGGADTPGSRWLRSASAPASGNFGRNPPRDHPGKNFAVCLLSPCDPGTPLDRRGLPGTSTCPKNESRIPILRPLRGTQKIPPDCLSGNLLHPRRVL